MTAVDDFVLRRWELAHYPGDQALPHVHRRSSEAFVVLSGRLEVLVGDERRVLEAGDHVTIPPGTVHTFATIDPSGAAVIAVMTPEVDELVADLHKPMTDAERADLWERHHSALAPASGSPVAPPEPPPTAAQPVPTLRPALMPRDEI